MPLSGMPLLTHGTRALRRGEQLAQVLADVLQEYFEELSRFRNVADWLCYLRMLQRGAIAFRAEALNYHRRHPSGVTITSADRRHLNEIAAMHQIVEQTVIIREEKRRAARKWRKSVARQFGLTPIPSGDHHARL